MPDEPADLNKEEEMAKDDDGWENRILCSDESCIGVIGADGRCKECGKPYQQPPDEQRDSAQSPAVLQADPDERPTPRSDDGWENRILCSDESCIGVIGADGRCKECGKPYKG